MMETLRVFFFLLWPGLLISAGAWLAIWALARLAQ
jgi:hypothetical protein